MHVAKIAVEVGQAAEGRWSYAESPQVVLKHVPQTHTLGFRERGLGEGGGIGVEINGEGQEDREKQGGGEDNRMFVLDKQADTSRER